MNDKKNTLSFACAMKALEEGKKVRVTMSATHCYIYLDENGNLINERGDFIWNDSWLWALIHSEWELYEESQKTYTFMEMLPFLKQGKKFRRKDWRNNAITCREGFIYILEKVDWVEDIIMSIECYEANDWIEVVE